MRIQSGWLSMQIKYMPLPGVTSLNQTLFNVFIPVFCCVLGQIAEAAAPRLQILNPNVQIQTETSDPEQLGDEFFKQFDVVCVLGLAAKSSFLVSNVTPAGYSYVRFVAGS